MFAGPGRDIWQTLTYAPFCCPVIPAGGVRRVEIIAVDPRARLRGSCHLFLALLTTSSSSSSSCRTGSVVLLQRRGEEDRCLMGFPASRRDLQRVYCHKTTLLQMLTNVHAEHLLSQVCKLFSPHVIGFSFLWSHTEDKRRP